VFTTTVISSYKRIRLEYACAPDEPAYLAPDRNAMQKPIEGYSYFRAAGVLTHKSIMDKLKRVQWIKLKPNTPYPK